MPFSYKHIGSLTYANDIGAHNSTKDWIEMIYLSQIS